MKKVLMLILIIVGCSVSETKAQKVALKSNLLYDATATMNLGLEFGLARKWTLDIPVNYHPWKPADGKRLRHWGVQPEVRYWFCERFNRTFMGLHGHYAEFNVGGWPDWSFISKNMQNTMGQVTTSAEQMLKGHKEVLMFGGQAVETKRFDKVSNKMRLQGMKMVSASSISDPVIQLIASLALAFVLYAASFPSVMETLTAGTITVVFSSMIALMRPLKSLTNVNAQFQRGMAACQTLFAILDSEQEKDEGKLVIERAKGNLEFKDVTFTYPGRETPALRNINLNIQEGKTVALVGRSGSGKSTIASLITRFYDIDNGQILLDGHDLREYTLASLRDQVALVSQNVHLFNDTVANNIAYARTEEYSREQIEEAARMAYAMDFISKMDNGLDTVIGENGVLLSGGQRQRIAIARALLRNSPILILDEATSALDTESERAIQAALDELQKTRTSLVIAHRLSTIEQADEIVVVEDGRIVERGSHADLLEHRGVYAQLHKMQFGQ